MEKVKLSSKGQLVIPKEMRDRCRWGPGTEFFIWMRDEEVVLRPVPRFASTQLESPDAPSVYHGPTLSLRNMAEAIRFESGKRK